MATMERLTTPLMLATNDTPQASCSNLGSYRPEGAGRPAGEEMRIEFCFHGVERRLGGARDDAGPNGANMLHTQPVEEHLENLKGQLEVRYERLEESKRLGLFVHATKRLFEIEGPDLAGLLALELFTTIIPLVLLGYSWASHFSQDLSFGDQLIRWMDLKGQTADIVRNLFGANANLRQTWTFLGIAGYLVWGIPMSSQVAKTFGRAFRRERYPFWGEVWRGTLWFFLFLGSQALTVKISVGHPGTLTEVALNIVGLLPSFVFWSVTPAILVRDDFSSFSRSSWPYLMWCGLVGVVLDTALVRLLIRFLIPALLSGWLDFGPIGVAMALMTFCTVVAALWVITAALSAVLWERRTPTELVLGKASSGS
jgi:uncharacterized BrkB/YihY/UPF0761 family membrane protein